MIRADGSIPPRGRSGAGAASGGARDRGRARARLPAELCGALADAGLYRLCVPARLGGAEAPPPELLEVVETLAEADAATGWCVAVCATAGMLAAYVEPAAADEVFGDRGSIAGGVFAPSGRAASRPIGRGSGRWRFASNVENCDWLMGGCLMLENGPRARSPAGDPTCGWCSFPPQRSGDRHLVGLRSAGDRQPRHGCRGDLASPPATRLR